jgi:hypothetical protein
LYKKYVQLKINWTYIPNKILYSTFVRILWPLDTTHQIQTLYQVYRHPNVSEILRSCTFHGFTLFLSPFYSVNVCLLFVNKKLSPFDQIRVGGCFYDFSILIWNCSDDVVFFVCHVNIWQINYNCNRIVGICNTIHLRNCMLFRLYLEKSLVPMAKNVRRM